MTEKKTLIIAQVMISGMMALSMSGIMSFIALGPSQRWLTGWPVQFAIAWPIAFLLTMVASRIGFKFAFVIAEKLKF